MLLCQSFGSRVLFWGHNLWHLNGFNSHKVHHTCQLIRNVLLVFLFFSKSISVITLPFSFSQPKTKCYKHTPITTPLKNVTTTRASIDKKFVKLGQYNKHFILIFDNFWSFGFWVSRAGACEWILIHRKRGGRPRTIFWVLIYTWGGTTRTHTHTLLWPTWNQNFRAWLYGTQWPTFHSTLWPNVLQKSHK